MALHGKYGPHLKVIGVTGGVGSGKSTVLGILSEMGVRTVEADRVAHDSIQPGTAAHRTIVDHFGGGVLAADGTVDRAKLADIVFAEPAELAFLNSVVHPPVIEQLRDTFKQLGSSDDLISVAVEIPLLVEAGLVDLVDEVILVTAPRDARVERMKAAGWPEERILAVMAAQARDAEKAKFADIILDNSGSVDELRARVGEFLAETAGASDAQ